MRVGVLQTMSGTPIRCSVGDDSRRDPLRSAAPELAIGTGGNLDYSSCVYGKDLADYGR
jgi:hypothetical protein